MRVLLTTLNAKYIHTNLAIRILYEQNYKLYPELAWKEFTIKEDRQSIANFCSQFEVVAFSCYIWNITQTLETARLMKELAPQVKILLGGPEVSYENTDIISQPEVDYIIEGEGEIPFAKFLERPDALEHVPGLVYKVDGFVKRNVHPPQFDIKLLEGNMPYQFDAPENLIGKVLYLETSRGCPYKCEFCLASLDNKVRYLPDSTIKATLLYLMQHGKVIKFLDRTFNIKRDFTLDIFRFILANRKPDNVFQFEITADILHPDIIKFIHEEVPPGVFRFEIGIQTVNQKANLAVSRKQQFEKTKKIILDLSYKIEMHLDLIVGLPLDYWADIKHSFEEVFKLYAPEMQLGVLKFLKGTTMRDMAQHEFVFDPNPPYQIQSSKYLSAAELARIEKLEHALEIYWNGKKALHTLRYVGDAYSSFEFLLALGEKFGEQHDYHKFSLTDVFDSLHAFALEQYPNDKVLHELIALDYYLHFKIKPQQRYLNALDKPELNSIVNTFDVSGRKRFLAFELSFDFEKFCTSAEISRGTHTIIIGYNGTEKAKLLSQHSAAIII
jgi:radical SAM superfamily enzyme YgiQ (UPF0313 family)